MRFAQCWPTMSTRPRRQAAHARKRRGWRILRPLRSVRAAGVRGWRRGRPRGDILVYDREVSLQTLAYFVAFGFDGGRVISIHDFLFARYAMDGIDIRIAILSDQV